MKTTILFLILLLALSALADSLHVSLAGHIDTPGQAWGVYVSGSYAFVADDTCGLRIIDVSTPSAPIEISYCDTPGEAQAVYISGSYAYIADGDYGLRIFEISDAFSPVVKGSLNTDGYARDIFVTDSLAYISCDTFGLRIIDVSNPNSPVEISAYRNDWYIRSSYIVDSYAFLANGSRGLRIIDISDPVHPSLVGFYDTEWSAKNVFVYGNFAFVNTEGGVQIINISIPSIPSLTSYYTGSAIEDVYIEEDYMYLADRYPGMLSVIDISNPSIPLPVGLYDLPDMVYDVFISGDYAYAANRFDGLYILDVSYFTGIEEKPSAKPEAFDISAYPNPFNGNCRLMIEDCGMGIDAIEVFDINGRMVEELPRLASLGTPSLAKGNSPLKRYRAEKQGEN